MDLLFAVQSHPNLRSKPEASSHVHSNSEARVLASRLRKKVVRNRSILLRIETSSLRTILTFAELISVTACSAPLLELRND